MASNTFAHQLLFLSCFSNLAKCSIRILSNSSIFFSIFPKIYTVQSQEPVKEAVIRQNTLPTDVSSTPPRSPTNLSPNLNAKRMAARRVSEPPIFHYPQNNNNDNKNNSLSAAHAMNMLNSLPSPPGTRRSKYVHTMPVTCFLSSY